MHRLYKSLALASFLLFVPVLAVQAYTFKPTVESVEQVSVKKPIPHEVTWSPSDKAENKEEGYELYGFEVTVERVSDEKTLATITTEIDDRSLVLNKSNVPGITVYDKYKVYVAEIYADSTSDTDREYFYTKPPKLKGLKIKKKQANSFRLKFKRGVRLAGESVNIEYKVTRRKNKSKLVATDSVRTSLNYVDIDGLPANKKLSVKARVVDSEYGNSKWSKWKNLKTKKK